MPVIMPADHHARFAGWAANKPRIEDRDRPWSSRKRLAFLALVAIASWGLLLSPVFVLG